MLPGEWEAGKGRPASSPCGCLKVKAGVLGIGQGLVGYQPLLGNTDSPPRLTRTRTSRLPWALPTSSELGTLSDFGITQQYPLLALGRGHKAGGSSMWLSV